MALQYTDNVTLLDGVGETTTSATYDVSLRSQITLQFVTVGGTSVFTVDVSNDGTNWVTGVGFLDAAATAVGTYVTSKSVASTTAAAIVTPGFRYLRVVGTWSSGTASAILEAAG